MSVAELETELKKQGLTVTPSALAMLESCTKAISIAQLTELIEKHFPGMKELSARTAVEIVASWPEWTGITSPALLQEVRARAASFISRKALSDPLQRTFETLRDLAGSSKSVSAIEVAKQTGLSRAAESTYLNKLVRRGYVKKERKGRKVLFRLP